MFTYNERGSYLIHLFDALPEEQKIAVVAIVFFILGGLSVLYLKKYKELSALQEEEERRELDEDISQQLREIELITKGSRVNSDYEELLKEVNL
jgi:hypothetical protein